FVLLKGLRKSDLIFTKMFFIFVVGAGLVSVIINRFFEFAVTEIDIVSGIWNGLSTLQKGGLILVPAFIIVYAYFYLASATLKLKARNLIIFILILGAANSPWRILL
ncbi:hypothetical protein HGB13_02285, partial [bacterium]|nr:hypothetical protein [bacterium]